MTFWYIISKKRKKSCFLKSEKKHKIRILEHWRVVQMSPYLRPRWGFVCRLSVCLSVNSHFGKSSKWALIWGLVEDLSVVYLSVCLSVCLSICVSVLTRFLASHPYEPLFEALEGICLSSGPVQSAIPSNSWASCFNFYGDPVCILSHVQDTI